MSQESLCSLDIMGSHHIFGLLVGMNELREFMKELFEGKFCINIMILFNHYKK
jgi:hypothetical protein